MKLLVLIPLLFTCCLLSTPEGSFALAQEPVVQESKVTDAPAKIETEKSDADAIKNKWPTFEDAFKDGVTSYEAKKYPEARLAFSRALEFNSESLNTLVNLALAEFNLGEKGLAVALLRKAVDIDPNFSTSQAALNFILPQLDVKEIPHEIQWSETLRDSVLVPVSLNTYLGLTALFLFAAGWLGFQYIGRRKRALKEETALPGFPVVAALALVGFLSFGFLTVYKTWDHQVPRGTVVTQKIAVLSAPDAQSPALFDLYSGLEVIVHQTQGDWAQVTYPGALSGWIPKGAVFLTSGKKLW